MLVLLVLLSDGPRLLPNQPFVKSVPAGLLTGERYHKEALQNSLPPVQRMSSVWQNGTAASPSAAICGQFLQGRNSLRRI